MPYFDLHCHPFFKPAWINGLRPDQDFHVEIDPGKERFVARLLIQVFGTQLRFILNSQSCLDQIRRADPNGPKIVVANLIAMENSYANLKFCAYKQVLQYVKNINMLQLDEVGGSQISYAQLLENELATVARFEGQNFGGFRFKLINGFEDVDEIPEVINVVVALEGGHNFYVRKDILAQESADHAAEVLDALVYWKKAAHRGQNPAPPAGSNGTDELALWKKTVDAAAYPRPRLLYVTLTHHTTTCLANQAFAVPPNFASAGTNPNAGGFNPTGNGITPTGREFVRLALRQAPDEDRVLIDLKHMSLKARRQFYDLRETLVRDEGYAPIPLIASHMGVTGLSWSEATAEACYDFPPDTDHCFEIEHKDSLKLLGFQLTPDTTEDLHLKFNPWSINLYDEEIRLIVASGGLIGLSFDDRILGQGYAFGERFSRAEVTPADPANPFPLPSIKSINFARPDTPDGRTRYPLVNHDRTIAHAKRYPEKPLLRGMLLADIRQDMGLLSLCQNVIHIIRRGGPAAWDCICIGSDFDGIIDAIDAVPDAGALVNLEFRFNSYLGRMVKALNDYFVEEATGETPLDFFPEAYQKFAYENGRRFLEKNFQRTTTVVPGGLIADAGRE